MRFILALTIIVGSASGAFAQYGTRSTYGSGLYGTGSNPSSHYARPYTTQSGAYNSGHYQTNPNPTQLDNYGTRGNINPYTGRVGTRQPRW
jgi:hypothetical protein